MIKPNSNHMQFSLASFTGPYSGIVFSSKWQIVLKLKLMPDTSIATEIRAHADIISLGLRTAL